MNKKHNPFSYKKSNDASGFLLYKTHSLWQREIKRSLKPFGITHTQFVILASTHWLILQQSKVTQIDIARHTQLDVMMTSNVIRTLEKKKILQRKKHPSDTRAKLIFLTDFGLETLKKSIKCVEDFDRQFFSRLQNAKTFNKELLRLLEQ